MSYRRVCDVCGGDLYTENQHAEFKIPKGYWLRPEFDGYVATEGKKKLDICFNCWHDFKKFVTKKGKK